MTKKKIDSSKSRSSENLRSSARKSKRPKRATRGNINVNVLDPQVLGDIHKKIISSAALNGGFDVLMYKIEKIEQNQEQLVDKVDKIHDAIYDPNDGIFSKISSSNAESTEKINETEQKLIEITQWKKQKEKEDGKMEEEIEDSVTRLSTLQKNVEDLVKSKKAAWGVFRWILVAVAGGSLTLLFKWLETKL